MNSAESTGFRGITILGIAVGLGLLLLGATGCSGMTSRMTRGLYLHSDADESRAKKALQTFEEIDLGTVVEIGRTNVLSLAAAQQEVDQRTTELLAKRDLLTVIAFESDEIVDAEAADDDPDTPTKPFHRTTDRPGKSRCDYAWTGWPRLRCDARERFEDYGLSTEELGRADSAQHEAIVDFINMRFDAGNAARQEGIVRRWARDYERYGGKRPTACQEVLTRDEYERTPASEQGPAWEEYGDLVRACSVVWSKDANLLLQNASVRSVMQELVRLNERRNQLVDEKGEARYGKLRRRITKLESRMRKESVPRAEPEAASTPSPQAAEPSVADQAGALEAELLALLKASDASAAPGVSRLASRIRSDVLSILISKIQAVGSKSDDDAAPNELLFPEDGKGLDWLGVSMLSLVRQDSVIGQRIGAHEEDLPSPNLLLLERGLHRMRYDSLTRELAALGMELSIRRQMLASYQMELEAWIRVSEAANGVGNGIMTERVDAYFASGKVKAREKEKIAEALIYYAIARRNGEERRLELERQISRQIRLRSLDRSEVAIQFWDDLIRGPLQEIATYYQGGFTAQEIAAFLNAVGVAAIAGGVY
jgi:hypothetical protein